jgi:hypothetical protein
MAVAADDDAMGIYRSAALSYFLRNKRRRALIFVFRRVVDVILDVNVEDSKIPKIGKN